MKNIIKPFVIAWVLCLGSLSQILAQPPRGFSGPEDMIKREKQNLYQQATDLSDDQKMLIDGIYNEYVVTLKENFEAGRSGGDREAFRKKIEETRNEKDALMKDVLSDDQYAIYQKITGERPQRKPQPENASNAETN